MNAPDSVVSLLQKLIQIPSINPDSAPDQGATGERDCAVWLGKFLEHCGAAITFEEVLPGRPNVTGRFPGGKDKPGLLFAPHTDTVSVRGMTIEPFSGEVREGRIWGRGASDTKGTMAAMLWALYELRDVIPTLTHSVSFVGLMGEEAGQPGACAPDSASGAPGLWQLRWLRAGARAADRPRPDPAPVEPGCLPRALQ